MQSGFLELFCSHVAPGVSIQVGIQRITAWISRIIAWICKITELASRITIQQNAVEFALIHFRRLSINESKLFLL